MFHEGSVVAWSLHAEPMAGSIAGETYEAFKARKQLQFRSRYSGHRTDTQQKLLRVHLRHFLLTVGAEIHRGRSQDETHKDPNTSEDKKEADEVAAFQSFAIEQQRLAVEREKARALRHRSARVLQSFARGISALREKAAIDLELPSTSIMVESETEKPMLAPLANPIVIAPLDVYVPLVEPPQSAAFPPYEVVAELLSARDLALCVGSSGAFDGKYIETELLLKRNSKVIARVLPSKQFVSSFQNTSAQIQLHDCSLRFAIDLSNDIRHGITSPQSVIDELTITVIVKATGNIVGGNANTLGVVGIPLSLLETPLATEYSLCRWFPLEKAYPGHTARGDLRVSVCYLMRQTNKDNFTMVPYVNTTQSSNLKEENTTPPEQKRPHNKRVKKVPTTVRTQRDATISKASQRKRAQQSTDQAANKSEKPKPPVLSLKDSLSSSMGRISRAEALSPPSSPSSVTSSEAGESPHSIESPKTTLPVKAGRRFFPAKRQQKSSKPTATSPREHESTVETQAHSPRSPPKNFLRRKPYKVVFQKLDWSGVASKTDSNLSTSSSSRNHSAVASRSSSRTSRSSSRASSASLAADNSCNTEADSATAIPVAFINEDTAQRLTALENAILERCGVTKETAPLARFKYQAERKKFVATLQSQTQNESPSLESSQDQLSESSVTELWRTLSGDASGQIYASMLRGLTERPPTSGG
ncbi:unnamed protein product [Phytophthora fragariaefolia]|uniref:Unnamed protein product n=1 Tax=Phytophthora fragariaefolia TaxID=1490495 RepID=A0A9W7D7Q0_9STRA|nr:unnamed protein product [Phytophthora fragariaefolia]